MEEKKLSGQIADILKMNLEFLLNYIENFGKIAFVVTDKDLNIKHANKAFLKMINLDDVKDKNFKIFLTPYVKYIPIPENGKAEKVILHLKCRRPDVNITLSGYVLGQKEVLLFFLEKRNFNYHELYEKISDLNNEISNLLRENQKKDYLIEKLKNEINETMRKDQLTGAYNRIYLKEIIQRELAKVKRYKIPLSIVLVDIENFKLINQNYGRTTGDKILKKYSNILMEYTRVVDMVFRYEEDNFLLMLPNTNIEGAKIVAKKIENITNTTLFENGISISVKTAAVECKEDDSLESLIDRAYMLLKGI
jgi:diguanylate cyclase (GGDEF)-like protein